ncbi:MAG TPA: hypothetical protein DCZ95_10400 [Verrucomicrobia bacterium]|nr:MAG: hypothetical protein A2X46_18745 [Lentisphaerae bacterium GWF2_57_35]HBA84492.1 hypothetical protein [Verrucomicrobiota bacterium]
MSVRQTPVTFGNARFTVYSSRCVRLEFSWGGRFSEGPSLLVGEKMAKAAKAEVAIEGKTLTIKTAQFELSYEDNNQVFSAENLTIVHKNKEGQRMVWAPGKKDGGNLGTVTRSLDQWKWCGGPNHFPVEGILSTDGGHFLADEPRVYLNKKANWPENRGNVVQFDGYFFAYGNDYKGALQDFVTVFGPIPMVPRWTFGFWYSRWYAYTDKEILELARRYQKEDIPIDVMIVDTDWRGGWGGYDWNKKYFPKPEKTMKALHDMGLQTSLNDHPGYDNYDSLPPEDSHIPAIQKRLGPLPHQGQWACDWSNPKALQAWKDLVLGPLFDQGMDFWWVDGWIKSPFANLDSQLWANKTYFELAEEKTNKRGMILSRWGGIGSHRYPVQFSGDTPSEWNMLQYQIEFTVRSGGLGAAYWSHDIGGFFCREKVEEELFVRWCQFGAMSPVFRTHSDHGIREPWHYSENTKALFRKQTHIRYALAPYFYGLAREAHDQGLPLIRPLYLEFNDNDGGALYRKHQYAIGRELLVIPADGPVEKKTGVQRKRAYFPNGRWFGLETDERYQGMLDGYVDIPIERIPTYVREGAILPSQKVGKSLGTSVPEEIHFDYFPSAVEKSEYELYEDDGESLDYKKGKFAVTQVSGRLSQGVILFQIAAPRGAYKGMPAKRRYVVRCRVEADAHVLAEVKVGSGEWKTAKSRKTNQCLAGTVTSGHTFCEVAVDSANEPVEIRILI